MEISLFYDFDDSFIKIIEVFTKLGYPQKLIEQWTLPQRDARTIAGIMQESQPRNILEVGTFVGLTTLLMALISPRETHIHTIDPNFPLMIEMGAMRSKMYNSNTVIKTQELAVQAADILGVKNKITFHAGGFSTNNTFASYNTSPSSRIQIIGPDICKHHGPFDFIFIDGLHYEEDVFSDVNLAAEHLSPYGLIALHDVLGPWGSNVRRAIFRFLEKHEGFYFSHDRLSEVNDTIGLLKKQNKNQKKVNKQIYNELKRSGLIQEKMFTNMAAVLMNMLCPSNIIQIGGDIRLLEQMINIGVKGECAYGSFSTEDYHCSIPVKQLSLHERNQFEKKYDLCIFLEIMDLIPAEYIDNIIQASIDASDIILFASSPPGEMGLYQEKNRPISYWIHKYFEKGYLFYDIIRPNMEPINYSDVLISEYDYNSSFLMNLYIVKKEQEITSDEIRKSVIEEIILRKERRIEDILLQNLFQKCIMYKNQQQLKEEIEIHTQINKRLYDELDRINIFNKKVMNNTLERIKEILKKYCYKLKLIS